jgi:hypothetical protein
VDKTEKPGMRRRTVGTLFVFFVLYIKEEKDQEVKPEKV